MPITFDNIYLCVCWIYQTCWKFSVKLRLKHHPAIAYSLLICHVILSCLILASLFMLMQNPILANSTSILNYIKCTAYFGFGVFFLINLGFLVSEFVKAKQKQYSFFSKFQELSSIKTSKEKLSIILDSILYFCYLLTFIISYLIGKPYIPEIDPCAFTTAVHFCPIITFRQQNTFHFEFAGLRHYHDGLIHPKKKKPSKQFGAQIDPPRPDLSSNFRRLFPSWNDLLKHRNLDRFEHLRLSLLAEESRGAATLRLVSLSHHVQHLPFDPLLLLRVHLFVRAVPNFYRIGIRQCCLLRVW